MRGIGLQCRAVRLLVRELPVQAEEYTEVLNLYGEARLLSYKAEPLGWDEMQAMAGGALVGLPVGYDAAVHAPRHYGEGAALERGGGERGAAATSYALPPGPPSNVAVAAAEMKAVPEDDRDTAANVAAAVSARAVVPRRPDGAAGGTEGQGGMEGSRRDAPAAGPQLNPLVGPVAEAAARHCLGLALEALQGGGGGGGGRPAAGPVQRSKEPSLITRRRELVLRAAGIAAEIAVSSSQGGPPCLAGVGDGAVGEPAAATAVGHQDVSACAEEAAAGVQLLELGCASPPRQRPQEQQQQQQQRCQAVQPPPQQRPPGLAVRRGSVPSSEASSEIDLFALD
jgi:hypothetical protein